MTRAITMWRLACLAGVLALVTAALWRDERRAELVALVGPGVAQADRDRAVTLLVIATFVVLGTLLAVAATLTERLSRGTVFTRAVLTIVVLLQAVAAPFAVQILTAPQAEGFVTTGLLLLQALLGVVGAALMWMPGAHRG